ncbi:hypothetical protein DLAC_06485 [Tieghemostelium lacteum]|uniref:RING-type domain-containing protein n=1 Tax=Tieghemostelium lacteum TaxID=361077 RepID=A0A151ZEW0_TIELA|nr:hypothetical protein DLAC_06485 [Tieghemostelium lacteum]|eukprot:KYQ92498.1 hypothetical protein DLAC_06485 [Tieghemostelium lacteum]
MIDCDIPFSILMMLKNQSGGNHQHQHTTPQQHSSSSTTQSGTITTFRNKRDSDISDSSGDEDYRSSSKSLQQLFVGLTEDFSCSICYELFDKPISLPCSHTFCKTCIEDLISNSKLNNNSNTFLCPLCRIETKIPEKGIDGFPLNGFFMSAIEKMKKANNFCPRFCDQCTTKKVARKCEQCNLFLCKGCCELLHFVGGQKAQHQILLVDSHISSDFDLETHNTKDSELDPPVYIPFNVSRSQCSTIFKNWISSLWFAPSDLKVNLSVRYIKPIYLPYWIFEVQTTTKYGALISVGSSSGSGLLTAPNIYNSHTKFDLIWNHKINIFSDKYRSAIISNNKLIDKDLLTQVQSWELTNIPSVDQSVPPNPKIQALAYLIDESTAWKKYAEQKIRTKDREVCENRIKSSCGVSGMAKDIFVETDITRVASQKVFLPVYFIKYIYDSKSYTVIVNAQNSKIIGHRPYAQGLSLFKMFK